jgi:hypothetical protein
MANLFELPAGKLHAFNSHQAEAGLTAELAARVNKDPSLAAVMIAALIAAITVIFKLVIDFAKSVGDLIADGKYDNIYGRENAGRFPTDGEGMTTVELCYLHIGRQVTDQEVLDEAERQGFRMSTLREFLAFGAANPEEQGKFPIATINPDSDRDGRRWNAVLDGDGRKRYLSLHWNDPQGQWDGHCRFLLARK